MADQTLMRVCSFFLPEAERFIQVNGLSSRFRVRGFPAICHGAPGSDPDSYPERDRAGPFHNVPEEHNPDSPAQDKDSGTLVLTGNNCPLQPRKTPDARQTGGKSEHDGISSGACLSLVAPVWLLENLVREGSYLVSPAWLADWEYHVAAWGFDTPGLREFAQDSFRQICLLDTLTLEGSKKRLADFSEALGLPALRIPVGMAHFSAVLQSTIDAKPFRQRPDADYAMALDLISRLGQFQEEGQVVRQLLEILSMLFAPKNLCLIRYENGGPVGVCRPFSDETALAESELHLCDTFGNHSSPSYHQDGFILPLDFNQQRLALVSMTDLAMPESRESYRNLLEAIVPILSLSLNNARNYDALLRNEKALRDKQKELLDTLEFRDRLLAIIGHDLRGPIGSMGYLLEVLEKDLKGSIPDREMQFLSDLTIAAHNASGLLLNLLEWAKLQSTALVLAPEQLLVRDEAATILSTMKSQAALKDIELCNEADPTFTVVADPNVIQTILRNLVSNALKYSHSGGRVTLRTSQAKGSRRIDIMDSGEGMDTETLAGVLDVTRRRSKTGTRGERGSGLGLVFCKELADKSGLAILIESTPGKGSTASVIFQELD